MEKLLCEMDDALWRHLMLSQMKPLRDVELLEMPDRLAVDGKSSLPKRTIPAERVSPMPFMPDGELCRMRWEGAANSNAVPEQ